MQYKISLKASWNQTWCKATLESAVFWGKGIYRVSRFHLLNYGLTLFHYQAQIARDNATCYKIDKIVQVQVQVQEILNSKDFQNYFIGDFFG